MGAASTFDVELTNAASDVLAVTGTATVAGTMAFDPAADFYADGTAFNVVTAGTRAGTFTAITGASINTFTDLVTSYTGTAVTVTVDRSAYATAATTANQTSVAGALDGAAAGAVTGDTETVLTALDYIGTTAAAAAAYDQMSAENYGGLVVAGQIAGDAFSNSIWGRLGGDAAAPSPELKSGSRLMVAGLLWTRSLTWKDTRSTFPALRQVLNSHRMTAL